jgi:molecular chaperone GrpE
VKERDEFRSLLLRRQAEFENYRKRTLGEREEFEKQALRGVLSDMLNIQDNFQRALGTDTPAEFGAYKEGVALIARQFSDLLVRYGVIHFVSQGQPFDHARHEAVAVSETAGLEAERVAEVYSEGYLLHDRVLRPARVRVERPAAAAAENVPSSDDGNS